MGHPKKDTTTSCPFLGFAAFGGSSPLFLSARASELARHQDFCRRQKCLERRLPAGFPPASFLTPLANIVCRNRCRLEKPSRHQPFPAFDTPDLTFFSRYFHPVFGQNRARALKPNRGRRWRPKRMTWSPLFCTICRSINAALFLGIDSKRTATKEYI